MVAFIVGLKGDQKVFLFQKRSRNLPKQSDSQVFIPNSLYCVMLPLSF
jgi:hypothetical protein